MFNVIPTFAFMLVGFVTQIGQAAQPTFRIDVGTSRGVDAAAVKQAFEDRADLSRRCYASSHSVARLHHAIRGSLSITVDIRQDGTISVGRIDDQAIGANNGDFRDCIHDKMLPKLTFPALDHVQYRTASLVLWVNP